MKPTKRTPGALAGTEGNRKTNVNGLPNTPECEAGLALAVEPSHFYCVSIYARGKHHKVAVWNGVRDYASKPPPSLVGLMDMGESKTIHIVQVSKPMNTPKRSVIALCNLLIKKCDHIILCARNQAVYDSIKAEYERKCNTLVSPQHLTPQ
jgi:hypothetical protein